MKRKKTKWICGIAYVFVIILLNLIAWKSRAFCDVYIAHVFPIWVGTYGRFTGMFPFSVGEWLIVAGVCLVLLAILLIPVLFVLAVIGKKRGLGSKLLKLKKGIGTYYQALVWILLTVGLIMTLNCTILYHGSTFGETYFSNEKEEYSVLDLVRVWNYVADNCNTLSTQVSRDENGRILYPGSVNSKGETVDMTDKARDIMLVMGQEYPRLKGYYPRAKAMFFSDFMCQQYMAGYYFPFSMEANYNDVMYVMNKPSTICHELAHLRGYILEDEANFISYLACVNSDDLYFQYSGYLSVLYYLMNEIADLKSEEIQYIWDSGLNIGYITLQVEDDAVFVVQEEWDRIEEEAVLDTETVDKAADVFIETNLQVNGVTDGAKSYSRVVQLMLSYYEKNPEFLSE